MRVLAYMTPPRLNSRSAAAPRTRALILLVAGLTLALAGVAAAQANFPAKGTGYVSDFANALSPAAKEQLTALCKEVDQKTRAQIAVVTVQSLNGLEPSDYAFQLATKWGIGPKQSSRGVLILMSIGDRKYSFATGYGLEPILPDGKLGGFGREAVPFLKAGDYGSAMLLITRRIADVIAQDAGVTLSGQPLPAPRQAANDDGNAGSGMGSLLLLGLFIFFIFFMIKRGGGGSGRGGGTGWLIASMLGSAMSGRGGWGGGGFGGGSSGGGGGGFGGFGGGSFGGGGASGSW